MTAILRVLTLVLVSCVFVSAISAPAHAETKPSPATGVKISTTESSATISWKAATGANSYRVCLQEFADQSPCARISKHSASTSVTFRSLEPTSGTDYYVVVHSFNGSGRAATYRQGFNLATPPPPGVPTQVTQTVSAHSATVTWAAATGAISYDVCLMTTSDATSCSERSSRSASRTATFDGLDPTSGTDYFFRIYAHNTNGATSSARYWFNLPVGTIASASVTREEGTDRVSSSWSAAVNAEQYEMQFGTNPSMTTGLKSYTLDGLAATFTRLSLGQTYHYRIRGINGAAKGTWTPITRFRMESNPTNVVVLTYNLCGQDKCVNTSNGMKKWSTRKTYAGAIARGTGADVIATQESHDRDTRFGTELPGFSLGAYYSAKSLYFNSDKYDKQRSGIITLDSTQRKYAVWVQLIDVKTRAMFIVVDAHLQPYKGVTKDRLREAQTKKLISEITRVNPNKFPVIYAGDYNSNSSNANQDLYPGGYDAPRKVFTAAGILDAFDIAQTKINPTWNSANQAKNPPVRHSHHVDHVFLDASIRALEFKVIVSVKYIDDDAFYRTPFATDHNPVRAKLLVPGH